MVKQETSCSSFRNTESARDTLLRRVVQAPEQTENRTRHVGIDEWAWHRGHRYGTLIVNLDTHRPWCYCQCREQRTLAAWFKKNTQKYRSSHAIVGIHALAARDGAPQVQVADRWHLLKNIGDALERMMYRQYAIDTTGGHRVIPQNRMLKRLWCQRQRYVAPNVLNESDVTNGISAGLR
ncbi:transposase [Klebsiella quasipneumoniae]|uniref:transposase n=1 Tax=Klebsiella quasipneumoniae TaxID=1463165 RepID=UPI00388EE4C0